MSRLVTPPTLQVFEGSRMEGHTPNYKSSDDYQSRLAKYIPAEATGGYVALENLAKPLMPVPVGNAVPDTMHQLANVATSMPLWPTMIFLFCLLFAPLYVYVIAKQTNNSSWMPQAAIAMIAFAIWAYAINGTVFQHVWGGNNPQISGMLLILFSMGIALYQPKPGIQ